MLILMYGWVGSGKTLIETLLAYNAYLQKQKVISNYSLYFPHEQIDFAKLLNSEYENCIICLDEIYAYLESRTSGKDLNKYMSYVLFQSRKKNLTMIGTMQLTSTIDLRFRSLCDILVYCEQTFSGYRYVMIQRRTNKTITKILPFELAYRIYSLYDTNEVIKPEGQSNIDIMLKFEPTERRKQRILELVNQIKSECPNIKKYTLAFVKTYFFEHKIENYLVQSVHYYLNEKEKKEE